MTKLLILIDTLLMLVLIQVLFPDGVKGLIIALLDYLLDLAMGY